MADRLWVIKGVTGRWLAVWVRWDWEVTSSRHPLTADWEQKAAQLPAPPTGESFNENHGRWFLERQRCDVCLSVCVYEWSYVGVSVSVVVIASWPACMKLGFFFFTFLSWVIEKKYIVRPEFSLHFCRVKKLKWMNKARASSLLKIR